MKLTDCVLKIESLKKAKDALLDSHKKEIKAIDKEIAELNMMKSYIGVGLDQKLISAAESVLIVEGNALASHVRAMAINDAITDLASGAKELRNEYIGVKNYAHFGDQRCDCKYGYGPTHGSIVFEVRLKIRDRELTNDEVEASIYYLNSIELIQRAKNVA